MDFITFQVKSLYGHPRSRLIPHLHDTTGCQTGLTTGLTTGCIV